MARQVFSKGVGNQGDAGRLGADAPTALAPPSGVKPASGLEQSRSSTGAKWSHDEAVTLCRSIEAICPAFGCHVALTGGTLYKDGPRKDADILFYRIRQVEKIDEAGLFAALAEIGVERTTGFGWCIKAKFEGKSIDCFFPEEDGEYTQSDDDDGFLSGLVEDDLEWLQREASVDTHAKRGDATQIAAPSPMSGAVAAAEPTTDAQQVQP